MGKKSRRRRATVEDACLMAEKHGRLATGFLTDECGICCEGWGTLAPQTLHCGHVFHTKCLREYQRVSLDGRCPTCRAWIGGDEVIHRMLQLEGLDVRDVPWWHNPLPSLLGHVFQQMSVARTGKDASAREELKWIPCSKKYDAAARHLCSFHPREMLETWMMSFEDRVDRKWVEDWQRANARMEFIGFALQCMALDLIGHDILYYSDFAKSWCRAVNLDVSPVWALAKYPDNIRPRTTYKQDFDACYSMLDGFHTPPVLRPRSNLVVGAKTITITLDDPQMLLLVRHYDVRF